MLLEELVGWRLEVVQFEGAILTRAATKYIECGSFKPMSRQFYFYRLRPVPGSRTHDLGLKIRKRGKLVSLLFRFRLCFVMI